MEFVLGVIWLVILGSVVTGMVIALWWDVLGGRTRRGRRRYETQALNGDYNVGPNRSTFVRNYSVVGRLLRKRENRARRSRRSRRSR